MTPIGIVTALGFEARILGNARAFLVHRCGVAGIGVEDAVRDLARHNSRLVVSWGTAGALTPQLAAGDLYLPDRILTRKGSEMSTDPHWRERFRAALGESCTARSGTLLDSPTVVGTPDEKRRLGQRSGADAVDMESGPVGEACAAFELPFLAIRAIVDEAHDRLPEQLSRYTGPDGSIRCGPLLASLMLHPREWGAVGRLTRRYGRARSALKAAARALPALS